DNFHCQPPPDLSISVVDDMGSGCSDTSCPPATPICVSGVCRGCLTVDGGAKSDECAAAQGSNPFCSASGTCVECIAPSDCESKSQLCDTAANRCVDCQTHAAYRYGACKPNGK